MFVKICGVRTEADVVAAAGADAIGLVLSDSVRQVDLATAARLVAAAPPHMLTVAVVAGLPVAEVARRAAAAEVGAVQLHGAYPAAAFAELAGRLPVRLVRGVPAGPGTDTRTGAYGEDMLLLDAAVGGSGRRWDLALLDGDPPSGPWLLAGGLDPDTVTDTIRAVQPWGVDMSSGVEYRRGVKDHGRIRAFVGAARAAGP